MKASEFPWEVFRCENFLAQLFWGVNLNTKLFSHYRIEISVTLGQAKCLSASEKRLKSMKMSKNGVQCCRKGLMDLFKAAFGLYKNPECAGVKYEHHQQLIHQLTTSNLPLSSKTCC